MSILGCSKCIFRKETWFLFLALGLLLLFKKMLTWLPPPPYRVFCVSLCVRSKQKGGYFIFQFYLLLLHFIYLFVAMLGIHCCTWTFIEVLRLLNMGFFLWSLGSKVVAYGLNGPKACGPSQTRDQACVPCIRQILILWTTREVPPLYYYNIVPQKKFYCKHPYSNPKER